MTDAAGPPRCAHGNLLLHPTDLRSGVSNNCSLCRGDWCTREDGSTKKFVLAKKLEANELLANGAGSVKGHCVCGCRSHWVIAPGRYECAECQNIFSPTERNADAA
jgi:hypothetical protein